MIYFLYIVGVGLLRMLFDGVYYECKVCVNVLFFDKYIVEKEKCYFCGSVVVCLVLLLGNVNNCR